MAVMEGQALWVHYPPSQTDATPLIQRARAAGCNVILLKYSEGNSPSDNTGYNYQQVFRALTPALLAAGFQVGAWIYCYPGDALGALCKAAKEDGASIVILDIEGEFETANSGALAQALIDDIKAQYSGPLGYAPFPYADLHKEYPYGVLDLACQVCLPQIYWRDLGDTPGNAYDHCWKAFQTFGLIGVGHASWQPAGQLDNGVTGTEVSDFAAICKNNGDQPILSISWWCEDTEADGLGAALATTPYATQVTAPQPAGQSVPTTQPNPVAQATPTQATPAWDPQGDLAWLKGQGLAVADHAVSDPVLWGQLATVLRRLRGAG